VRSQEKSSKYYLVGGFNPSEEHQSVRIIIPNIWKNKNCSKPPTSLLTSEPFLDIFGIWLISPNQHWDKSPIKTGKAPIHKFRARVGDLQTELMVCCPNILD